MMWDWIDQLAAILETLKGQTPGEGDTTIEEKEFDLDDLPSKPPVLAKPNKKLPLYEPGEREAALLRQRLRRLD